MKKSIHTILVFLLSLLGVVFVSAKGGSEISSPFQIYSVDKEILIQTKVGYNYTHIQGDSPDWRVGALKQVELREEAIAGNGKVRRFQASIASGYHVVEETKVVGTVDLRLEESLEEIAYFSIRKEGEEVFSGQITPGNTLLEQVELPYGQYKVIAKANGHQFLDAVGFNLSPEEPTTQITLLFQRKQIPVHISIEPRSLSSGRMVIVRKIDPRRQKVISQQTVDIDQGKFMADEGQYTVEFPQIEGYLSPGMNGVVGRFDISSDQTPADIIGRYLPKPGTLIVTFSTEEPFQDHLKKILFYTIDETGKKTAHPSNNDTVESISATEKRVTISQFQSGIYRIEHNIPGGIFEAVESQEVRVQGDKVAVTQIQLKPRYASLKLNVAFEAVVERDVLPVATLLDKQGKEIGKAVNGKLEASALLPGAYKVVFEPVKFFEQPADLRLNLKPGETFNAGTILYKPGKGSLAVTLSTGDGGLRKDTLGFDLIDSKGARLHFPERGQAHEEKNGRKITVDKLKAGDYTIEFHVENSDNLFLIPPSKSLTIPAGGLVTLSQVFQIRYGSLNVQLKLPEGLQTDYPTIRLTNESGIVAASDTRGHLAVKELLPGKYTITFSETPSLIPPEPLKVTVEPGKETSLQLGNYKPATGTLTVKYSTGSAVDRLDRIRFFLIDAAGNREMYPKEVQGEQGSKSADRTIKIPQIKTGDYFVEFLLPNNDGLFATPFRQKVTIQKNQETSLVQEFTPRFGSLSASVSIEERKDGKSPLPTIYLYSGSELAAKNNSGKLYIPEIAPGDYVLRFETMEDYDTPAELPITIHPEEHIKDLAASYRLSRGSVTISYNTGVEQARIDQMQIWLKYPDGNKELFPKNAQDVVIKPGKGRELTIGNLAAGTYELEFAVPNTDGLFKEIPRQKFKIMKNAVSHIHQEIKPNYAALKVKLTFPYSEIPNEQFPSIVLRSPKGKIISQSQTGTLEADALLPGDYEVVFSEVKNGVGTEPKPIKVKLAAGEINDSIIGEYALGRGSLAFTFNTGPEQVAIKRITFVIQNSSGFRKVISSSSDSIYPDPDSLFAKRLDIKDLPSGRYTLNIVVADNKGLFADIPERTFYIRDKEVTKINQDMSPRFGGIEAFCKWNERSDVSRGVIQILNSAKREVSRSENGHILVTNLTPGDYEVVFADVDFYETPKPLAVKVAPSEIRGPLVGEYIRGTGTLVVKYDTGGLQEQLDLVKFSLTDEAGIKKLYPVGNEGLIDPKTQQKSVTLSKLPAGRYSIEFQPLEGDFILTSTQQQKVEIHNKEVQEFTYSFQPRYGSLRISLMLNDREIKGETGPMITLKKANGAIIATTDQGDLSLQKLVPGDYEILFGSFGEYDPPEPIKIKVEPEVFSGHIVRNYLLGKGSLQITYDTQLAPEFLSKVMITVWNESFFKEFKLDSASSYTVQDDIHRVVNINNLTSGHYMVTAEVLDDKGIFPILKPVSVNVSRNQKAELSFSLTPKFAQTSVKLDFAKPKMRGNRFPAITLKGKSGQVVQQSVTGSLEANKLPPGEYRFEFEEIPYYTTPASISFKLKQGEEGEKYKASYTLNEGSLALSYDTGDFPSAVDEVRVTIKSTDDAVQATLNPSTQTPPTSINPSKRLLKFENLVAGKYVALFEAPVKNGLFTPLVQHEVVIEANQETKTSVSLVPHYGGVTAACVFPDNDRGRSTASIVLLNEKGERIASENNKLSIRRLPPGKYKIIFGDHPLFETPSPQEIDITADTLTGPYQGIYIPSVTSLVVRYSTGPKKEGLEGVSFWLTDRYGKKVLYPETGKELFVDQGGDYKTVRLDKLPVGEHTIQFILPNETKLFSVPPQETIQLEKGKEYRMEKLFQPRYASIDIRVNGLETESSVALAPLITLNNDKGKQVLKAEGRLTANELLPGRYQIVFGAVDHFVEPESKMINLNPGQILEPITGVYKWSEGSLNITYSTGDREERLDRIRFWLVHESGNREMLPQTQGAVYDALTHSKSIELKSIPAGKYTLEILAPNTDAFFGTVQNEYFVLGSKENKEISIQLIPHYGSLEASYIYPVEVSSKRLDDPVITVDREGEQILSTSNGRIFIDNLIPGKYTVRFGTQEYVDAPEAITVDLKASEHQGPIIGKYTLSKGALQVSYSTGTNAELLSAVQVTLTDALGSKVEFEKKIQESKEDSIIFKEVVFPAVPVGKYKVSLTSDEMSGLFAQLPSYDVEIKKSQQAALKTTLVPLYSTLEVVTEFDKIPNEKAPVPSFEVKDSRGTVVAKSSEGRLLASQLIPGSYQIVFKELSNYQPPKSITVELKKGEHIGPIVGKYERTTGQLMIQYDTGPEHERIRDIQVRLKDESGHIVDLAQFDRSRQKNNEKGESLLISKVPVGKYIVELNLNNEDKLFEPFKAQAVEICEGHKTIVNQSFKPHYATLDVVAQLPFPNNSNEEMPGIILRDKDNNVVMENHEGRLLSNKLIPGEYIVNFLGTNKLVPPSDLRLVLAPDDRIGPLVSAFERGKGSAVVTIHTDDKENRLSRGTVILRDETGKEICLAASEAKQVEKTDQSASFTFSNIPTGHYTVETYLPNDDNFFASAVQSEEIDIYYQQVTAVSCSYEPIYEEIKVAATQAGSLHVQGPPPGQYEVAFDDVRGCATPSNFTADLMPSTPSGPIAAQYTAALGSFVLTYFTNPEKLHLKEIRFTLTDANGKTWFFPSDDTVTSEDPATNGIQVKVDHLPEGEYVLEFTLPKQAGLMPDVPPKKIYIQSGKTTFLHQTVNPRYGSLQASILMPAVTKLLKAS